MLSKCVPLPYITTKSDGLVLLLCGYLSFISEMLARVRGLLIVKGMYTPAQRATLITTYNYVATTKDSTDETGGGGGGGGGETTRSFARTRLRSCHMTLFTCYTFLLHIPHTCCMYVGYSTLSATMLKMSTSNDSIKPS